MSVEGDKELDKRLQEITQENPQAEKRGLRKGAAYLQDQLSRNAPYDSNTKYHLRDDVQVSNVKNEDGYQSVKIGWGKQTAWRVHFTEFGTMHHPPNAFVESTEKDSRDAVFRAMEDEIRRSLNL